MPNQLTPILLVGCGAMASAYAKVLRDLGRPFHVMGRNQERAEAFGQEWGVSVSHGPLSEQLSAMSSIPETAIIAVSALSLAEASETLISVGCRRLLIEKPAALDPEMLQSLAASAVKCGAEAFVAYNRRFYASTMKAEELISADGGALSLKFDFTEATRRIEALKKNPEELSGWFFGNSTHVIDLAFFLAGDPVNLHALSSGQLSWHAAGAIFVGCGVTEKDVRFSWHADWLAPGRWGVEIMTAHKRLVLQPMEQLFCQDHHSFNLEQIALDDELDKVYKPGLFRQTKAFLAAKPDRRFLSLAHHAALSQVYSIIRDGGDYVKEKP